MSQILELIFILKKIPANSAKTTTCGNLETPPCSECPMSFKWSPTSGCGGERMKAKIKKKEDFLVVGQKGWTWRIVKSGSKNIYYIHIKRITIKTMSSGYLLSTYLCWKTTPRSNGQIWWACFPYTLTIALQILECHICETTFHMQDVRLQLFTILSA